MRTYLLDSDALVEALCDADVLADSDALVEALCEQYLRILSHLSMRTHLQILMHSLRHFVMR